MTYKRDHHYVDYGFSAGKLNELFWVKKDEFFNSLAEDSDICKSFTTVLGGALTRALLMSGVTPLMRRSFKEPLWFRM